VTAKRVVADLQSLRLPDTCIDVAELDLLDVVWGVFVSAEDLGWGAKEGPFRDNEKQAWNAGAVRSLGAGARRLRHLTCSRPRATRPQNHFRVAGLFPPFFRRTCVSMVRTSGEGLNPSFSVSYDYFFWKRNEPVDPRFTCGPRGPPFHPHITAQLIFRPHIYSANLRTGGEGLNPSLSSCMQW